MSAREFPFGFTDLCPQVDNPLDYYPRPTERGKVCIGARVVGIDHRAMAGHSSVAGDVPYGRISQHDPRPVIAREDQWPLDRAGGDQHLFCPDMPEPLTDPLLTGFTLHGDDHVVIVITRRDRVLQPGDVFPALQILCNFIYPPGGQLVIDGGGAEQQVPARCCL